MHIACRGQEKNWKHEENRHFEDLGVDGANTKMNLKKY